MDAGDLIYSLLTLFFFLFLIVSPRLRKILPKILMQEEDESPPKEDPLYESVDNHRVTKNLRTAPETLRPPPIVNRSPESVIKKGPPLKYPEKTTMERIENLPSMKRALVWSEILGKPKGF